MCESICIILCSERVYHHQHHGVSSLQAHYFSRSHEPSACATRKWWQRGGCSTSWPTASQALTYRLAAWRFFDHRSVLCKLVLRHPRQAASLFQIVILTNPFVCVVWTLLPLDIFSWMHYLIEIHTFFHKEFIYRHGSCIIDRHCS